MRWDTTKHIIKIVWDVIKIPLLITLIFGGVRAISIVNDVERITKNAERVRERVNELQKEESKRQERLNELLCDAEDELRRVVLNDSSLDESLFRLYQQKCLEKASSMTSKEWSINIIQITEDLCFMDSENKYCNIITIKQNEIEKYVYASLICERVARKEARGILGIGENGFDFDDPIVMENYPDLKHALKERCIELTEEKTKSKIRQWYCELANSGSIIC